MIPPDTLPPVVAPTPAASGLPPGLLLPVRRGCLVAAGLAALAGAVLIMAVPGDAPAALREMLAGALALYGVLCAAAWSLARRWHTPAPACLFFAGAGIAGVGFATALAFGEGLHSPLLGLAALAVCVLCGMAPLRWGLALAALCAAQLTWLGWAQLHGLVFPAAVGRPVAPAWAMQMLLLGAGAAAGTLLSRVLAHTLAAASEREQRFGRLLELAVEWYWEQDEHLRFTRVSTSRARGCAAPAEEHLGRTPWEVATLVFDEATLAAHRADLQARRPFSHLVVRRITPEGERILSVSGEPRHDARGRFRGYWGVGRDVTDELHARHATEASESRYRQLFQRSPSPLLLHRQGIVSDANDAAARMFGFERPEQMKGFDLREASLDADSLRRMNERIAQLERMPPGAGLPIDDYKLVSRQGEHLMVQATAARVETDEGPASLWLYFDVTPRVNAEAALRRSQALLSHLIGTSPDLITLTELATGRYELVNRSFERVTGWTADEVVGRTSNDIAIWYDPADRDALVDALQARSRADDMLALLRCKSGELVSVRVSAARFTMDQREYLVLNGRDVTATERARLEHDAILKNASIGIAFTRERFFQHTNPSFDRMFGWQPGQLEGQAATVIWPHQDDYDAMRAQATPVLAQGQTFEIERQMRRADGSLFWCRMRGQAVDARAPRGGTIWIAEDVTERRQVDQALAAARDAAEAASRAKSAFLANTSHEIRTPLNGLLGLARLAMQEGQDEARRAQYIAQIFDSAHSLSAIISDILDLSKIEAGKIMLESVPFGLRDTLVSVHDTYQSLADAKRLELVLAIDGSVPATVRGDPVRVRQILSNFVTNALKFTERGRVRIHAGTVAPGRVRLSVTDTGPGIDEATQQRLFMPFSQADDSTTRRYGGTGLGLSICRELAHLMGGEVGVISASGSGSTFWAELALPPAQASAAEGASKGALHASLLGARVLMVEDNAVNMLVAVAMLEQWGVAVTEAVDGRAALAAVEESVRKNLPFDAVLMDVQMPGMSGHEVARELRRRHDAQALPIIALTAAALVSERDAALASGMTDFLTKPIDAERLRQALVRAVRRHRRSQAP